MTLTYDHIGSVFFNVFLFLISFTLLSTQTVNALSYGTTCETSVDLSTTIGTGAGFAGLIDTPFDKSWFRTQLGGKTTDVICSNVNNINTLIASQQWVWYSLNAGLGSYFLLSTLPSHGADTGSADTLLFTTKDVCSSTSQPNHCNDDYAEFSPKSLIQTVVVTGAYKLAIGQYASSLMNGVTYSAGKTSFKQFCSSSCSACQALPAKLFYPNSAAEYTYLNGVSSTSSCGTFYDTNFFTFTAPSAGTVLVSTCPTDGAIKTHSLKTMISVYTTCTSEPIACGNYPLDCLTSARVTFTVTQGTTYTVAIALAVSGEVIAWDSGKPVFTFTCAVGTYDHDNNQNTACATCTPLTNCTSLTCTTSSNSACTACSSGSYLSSGSCLTCSARVSCKTVTCSSFANSICTSCDSGYYLNGGSCLTCLARTNCLTVTCSTSANSVCTSCDSGYYISSGSCAVCAGKENCGAVTCTSGSISTCTSCNNGYYLSGGSCTACTPVNHCTSALTCSSSSNSVCTSCESGYLVSGGSCASICGGSTYFSGSSCLNCSPVTNCTSAITCTNSSNSVCTACKSGSYLNSGSCLTCSAKPNCNTVTCSDGLSSTCTQCNSGYYLNSGSCSPCTTVPNCNSALTCSTASNSVCTSCVSGFYLNSGACTACTVVSNCNSALTCSTSANSVCTSCVSGFYVNSGSCTACTAVPNCNSALTCSTSSNSVCNSCSSGFYINNGVCTACTAVPNCNSAPTCSNPSNSACSSCISGFYVNNGACTACTSVPNCNSPITCSTSANSVCTSCNNGYYLNSGTCTPCTSIPNCNSGLTCSSPSNSVCTSCVSGTYLSSPNSCSNCLSKSNCTSVSCSNGTVSTCTACNEGYTLSNGNCIINNSNEEAASSPVAAIGGAVGGGVVLIAIIVIIFVLKRRKSSRPKSLAKLRAIKPSLSSVSSDENTFPLTSVSISSNPNFASSSSSSSSSSTSKIYDAPSTSRRENEYEALHLHGNIPSAGIYDYATPYSTQVLSYSFTKKDVVIDGVIGNGSFGVVKLGKIPNSRVPPHCKDLISRDREDSSLSCAIKTLKENSDEKSKRDFAAECKMMSNFNHPNVIRVIAVLLDASPSMLVTEFMKYGDLRGVLHKSETRSLFWYEKEFLYVAQQIAQGMEYLESIRFIHRDLAARNCLVSDDLTVKISDFGLSKELDGEKDYYKLQTKGRLPVKWMAPESIGYRRFTHASDVWSFGVTIWEVFSYAHTPYGDLRAQDVLSFIERGERLECPSACFSIPIVYEWMLKCWEHDPNNRPTFNDSVKFLSSQLKSPKINVQEIRNIGGLL